MYLTLLFSSFRMRKLRVILPVIAIVIGVSVGSALFMISYDMEDKIATELRNFGPNLIVVPESEDIELTVGGISMGSVTETKYIPEQDAMLIRDLPIEVFGGRVKGILGKNAFLYGVVTVDNDASAIVAGTWFDQLTNINTWWNLNGEYPTENGSVVLGMRIAQKLGKMVGDTITLSYSEVAVNETTRYEYHAEREFIVSGIVMAGGEDDSRIFGRLDEIQNLTNKENKVNIMHISALCNACPLKDIAEIIEGEINGVEVLTVKQIAKAEMDTLDLIQNLVGLITVVSLVASIMAVTTTMSLSVVERRKEIGLMKAVGALHSEIALLFLGEGVLIALAGGILGFALGALLSQFIGDFVFESSIMVRWWMLPVSLALSFGIVLISMVLPIRKALTVDPAIVLRGE